ncbi:hypothetical protein [Nocardiopsis alba]
MSSWWGAGECAGGESVQVGEVVAQFGEESGGGVVAVQVVAG